MGEETERERYTESEKESDRMDERERYIQSEKDEEDGLESYTEENLPQVRKVERIGEKVMERKMSRE